MSRPGPGFAPPTGQPAGQPVGRPATQRRRQAGGALAKPQAADATPAQPQGSGAPEKQSRPGVVARARGLSTPALLGWLRALALFMTLLFGATALGVMQQTYTSMSAASDDTRQYQRVQNIEASLLSAHATAANGFLVGGVQTAEAQSRYTEDLQRATRLTTEASNAQPADREALARLGDVITEYSRTIEGASVANAQGLPVGQTRLMQATTLLSDQAQPLLKALGDANAKRLDANTRTIPVFWLVLTGTLALASLALTMIVMARRTHRIINVPTALATAIVLGATTAASQAIVGTNSTIRDTRGGDLRTAQLVSSARAFAYDAKAMESLGLLSREAFGGSFERRLGADGYQVRTSLRESGRTNLYDAYRGWVLVHREVARENATGDWDRAVAQATGNGAHDSNPAFQTFDEAATQTVEESSRAAADAFQRSGRSLSLGVVGVVVATLVAMVATALGVGRRRKEYL